MDFGLKGKNVLITGSTKGLGKAIAEVAAEEGANVVVSGRKEEEAKALASSIASRFGVKALPVAADLGQVGAAEDLFSDALAAMGSLDILVNNAGIWPTAYDPKQSLRMVVTSQAVHQFFDGFGLVAGRLEIQYEFKIHGQICCFIS